MFDLVEAGFNQRRKMLRRSLAAKATAGDLEAAGIRPEARAEELTLADWLRLAAVCLTTRPSRAERSRRHADRSGVADVVRSGRVRRRGRARQAHAVAAGHRECGPTATT